MCNSMYTVVEYAKATLKKKSSFPWNLIFSPFVRGYAHYFGLLNYPQSDAFTQFAEVFICAVIINASAFAHFSWT